MNYTFNLKKIIPCSAHQPEDKSLHISHSNSCNAQKSEFLASAFLATVFCQTPELTKHDYHWNAETKIAQIMDDTLKANFVSTSCEYCSSNYTMVKGPQWPGFDKQPVRLVSTF